jgi:regulator of sigma D
MAAAVAHEITHWQRWLDKTELVHDDFLEIDEALTSLEAALRFHAKLSDHDVRQLIADAIQRLQMFAQRKS